MGAPIPKVEPVDNATAEALLSSLVGMAPAERRKHASIFNYWLSIRGDRQFPPIRDLDPLEISDAGPWSVLLELIGAGENAVVRHLGQAIKLGVDAETIARAPDSSLLACIHSRLPTVASSMQALSFEDEFQTDAGAARCWVTLLPFSATGAWIDYVYGIVSLDTGEGDLQPEADSAPANEELESSQVPLRPLDEDSEVSEANVAPMNFVGPDTADAQSTPEAETEAEAPFEAQAIEPELEGDRERPPLAEVDARLESELQPLAENEPEVEPGSLPVTVLPLEPEALSLPELKPEPEELILEDSAPSSKAGFSAKFLESLAHVGGFYGRVVHAAPGDQLDEPDYVGDPVQQAVADEFTDPVEEAASEEFSDPANEPVSEDLSVPVGTADADEAPEPTCKAEGTLQDKLSDVRAMAEEARQAQLRSNQALYAGLGAAYDFALDAEDEPEEYLRLVEGQGLKIQLRSPMKPVVKLAFAETCDAATVAQLEAVLAWALKNDLPRGSLAERIEAEGGLGPILEASAKAA